MNSEQQETWQINKTFKILFLLQLKLSPYIIYELFKPHKVVPHIQYSGGVDWMVKFAVSHELLQLKAVSSLSTSQVIFYESKSENGLNSVQN